jgi:hypothetical protein
MSDKPIGDLRRRLIADMTIRTFNAKRPNCGGLVAARYLASNLLHPVGDAPPSVVPRTCSHPSYRPIPRIATINPIGETDYKRKRRPSCATGS